METATQQKMAERLSVVEAPARATQVEDLKRLTDGLAAQVINAGRFAREHGQYIDELSNDFAKQLIDRCRAYMNDVLAAEGRRAGELKRLMGNERGPTPQG